MKINLLKLSLATVVAVVVSVTPALAMGKMYKRFDGPVFLGQTIVSNIDFGNHAEILSRTVEYQILRDADGGYSSCSYSSVVANESGDGVSCEALSSAPGELTLNCFAKTLVDQRTPVHERRLYNVVFDMKGLTCTTKDGSVKDFGDVSVTVGYGFNWIHKDGWERRAVSRPELPENHTPWRLISGTPITFPTTTPAPNPGVEVK